MVKSASAFGPRDSRNSASVIMVLRRQFTESVVRTLARTALFQHAFSSDMM